MGILDITNRTENWKTARTFAPFFECDYARTRLAKRLLKPLGRAHEVQAGTVKIELFWYGMRDHIDMLRKKREPEPTPDNLADRYTRLFHDPYEQDLRGRIEKVDRYKTLTTDNYDVSDQDRRDNLRTNLKNTEIDICLETSQHLFIGEAKHETTEFDRNKDRVLMHQLIRQYVMVSILVDWLGSPQKVVPFIVGDDPMKLRDPHPNLKHVHQISFLRDQGWLNEKNILSWDCIEKLTSSAANNG